MRLYGTTTSPFVRRVRVVGHMLGLELPMTDVRKEEGQAALRSVSPIWKVPAVETPEGPIFDSHVIIDYILERYGNRGLRHVGGDARWRELNIQNAIDACLDSAINSFYLINRDGADPRLPYLAKQKARVGSILSWLEAQLHGVYFTADHHHGLSEIYLMSAIEWIAFREAAPLDVHPALLRFREAHASFPAFAATVPHE